MQYENYRDSLATGDIVLFQGKGLISRMIQWITRSRWSHVGMVIRIPEYDFVCIWESTTLSNVENLVTGKKVSGVQIAPLSKRIAEYDGTVAIRFLTARKLDVAPLMELRKKLKGRSYEQNKLQLLRSVFKRNEREDLTSVFCSELVAEAYQRLGLLMPEERGGFASNQYTPADFGNRLPLHGGKLDKPLIVKGEKA